MKKNVDSYEPNKRIPKCQLVAKFSETKDDITDLIYRVKLIGAREPQNEFTIYFSPSINNECNLISYISIIIVCRMP